VGAVQGDRNLEGKRLPVGSWEISKNRRSPQQSPFTAQDEEIIVMLFGWRSSIQTFKKIAVTLDKEQADRSGGSAPPAHAEDGATRTDRGGGARQRLTGICVLTAYTTPYICITHRVSPQITLKITR